MPSSASEVALAVRLQAKDGRAEELRRALSATVEPTRREEGCRLYRLHRSASDSNQFFVYECWASQEAIERHENTEHMQALQKAFETLLAEHDIERYERMAPAAADESKE